MPNVSIIMTVLNGEKFISKSIESILSQTFKDWELIIVNDYSTDSTLEIIENYKSQKIKLINNKKNMGTAISRNIAISQADGNYITIVDSDDIVLPKKFEMQKEYLDKYKNIGLVGCNYDYINENDEIKKPNNDTFSQLSFASSPEYIKWGLLWNNVICHSSVMFRKSLFEKIGGYKDKFPFSCDYYLWTDFNRITKIYQFPQKLLYYRIHDNMMSKTETLDKRKYQKLIVSQVALNSFLKRQLSLETVEIVVGGYGGKQPLDVESFTKMKNITLEIYSHFKSTYKLEKKCLNLINNDMLRMMLLWHFYHYNLNGIWDRTISWKILKTVGSNALLSKQFYRNLFSRTFIERLYSTLIGE